MRDLWVELNIALGLWTCNSLVTVREWLISLMPAEEQGPAIERLAEFKAQVAELNRLEESTRN